MLAVAITDVGLSAALALGLLGLWALAARDAIRSRLSARRLRGHLPAARAAALEAALDEPQFDPDAIAKAVGELVKLALDVRFGGADPAGNPRWTPALAAWGQHLRGRRDAYRRPRVDVVRIVNRADEATDQAIVRVAFGRGDVRWTLGRSGGHWVLAAVGGSIDAPALLAAPHVAAPDTDLATLRHAGLAEVATDEPAPAAPPGELVRLDAGAGRALLELAALDERFMPALLESTARRLVAAWEAAALGQEFELRRLAAPDTVDRLLGEDGAGRLLRDTVVVATAVERIERDGDPAEVLLAVEVEAVEALVAGGRLLSGSAWDRRRLTLRLRLRADGPPEDPWRAVWAGVDRRVSATVGDRVSEGRERAQAAVQGYVAELDRVAALEGPPPDAHQLAAARRHGALEQHSGAWPADADIAGPGELRTADGRSWEVRRTDAYDNGGIDGA